MRLINLLLCLLFCTATVQAQYNKTIYQTIKLDTVQEFKLALFDYYDVKQWAGNNVLIEANINMHFCSKAVFDHFLEAGRYATEAIVSDSLLLLQSKDTERKPIQTKNGTCEEQVSFTIFIPDTLIEKGEDHWEKPAAVQNQLPIVPADTSQQQPPTPAPTKNDKNQPSEKQN